MTIPLRLPTHGTLLRSKPAAAKDIRLWLGVLLILIASITGGKLFASANHRVPAVVVIHDLAAGSQVRSSDVQIMNVAVPQDVVTAGQIDAVVGKYLTHDIASGSLLNPSIVSAASDPRLRSVSVPIKAGHLPELSYGTRVDVWFTPSMDGAVAPGPATLLASDVVIQAVPQVFDSAVDMAITLQVEDEEVPLIVQAMRDGTLDIAVIGAN